MSYKSPFLISRMAKFQPVLTFDPEKTPLERVLQKLNTVQIPVMRSNSEKKKISDKFWKEIEKDIEQYEKHINAKDPFIKTCYSKCPNTCIQKFDKAYWSFITVGFKGRKFVSAYKMPAKIVSITLIFLAGLFKMIRANQDGKASFYGNVITAANQILLMVILVVDGDYVMTIPRIAGFLVAITIMIGIANNADQDGVGL